MHVKVGFPLFAYVFSFVSAMLVGVMQWGLSITDTGITHEDFCAVNDFRTGELKGTEFARARSCRASTANAGAKLEIKEEAECYPECEHSAVCHDDHGFLPNFGDTEPEFTIDVVFRRQAQRQRPTAAGSIHSRKPECSECGGPLNVNDYIECHEGTSVFCNAQWCIANHDERCID